MTDEFTPTAVADLLEPDAPFDDEFLLTALDAEMAQAWYQTAVDDASPEDEAPEAPFTPEAFTEVTRPLRWEITGTGSAGWAMAKYGEAQEVIDDTKTQADIWRQRLLDEIVRINEWETATASDARRKADFFVGHLQRWALANRTDKQMSFKLPAGTVTTHASGATFEIEDMAAAVEFAVGRDAPTKTETNVTSLKPAVKIVDHLVYIPAEDQGGLDDLDPEPIPDGTLCQVFNVEVKFVQTHSAYDIEFNEADPDDGVWTATNTFTGEVLPVETTIIEHGPFVVDATTGVPVHGLKAKPGKITAKVKLA